MHNTLDEMKHSLSFISSKLGANKTSNNLTNNEISQLQDRLASTEAQMYKILHALDAASNKMHEITKNTRETLEQPRQVYLKNKLKIFSISNYRFLFIKINIMYHQDHIAKVKIV